MEIVNHNVISDTEEKLSPPELNLRTKTSTRMHYEAQVAVIQRQIGDLESLRASLGLSARKMCQLLLVDPSAWTRWKSEGAPPHIWRALQWYSILQERIPGLTPQYFTGKDPEVLHQEALKKLHQTGMDLSDEFSRELSLQNQVLSQKMERLERLQNQQRWMLWALASVCLVLASLLLFRGQ